jgi:hypothetical protein
MEVELLPAQWDLLQCDAPVAAMLGGIGAGKSFTLSHFVLQQVVEYPDAQGLICANSFSQINNATLPAVTSLLNSLSIKYELVMSGAKKRLLINNRTNILIYSLENAEIIRGVEVGWIAVDEVAYSYIEALNIIFGRLRDKRGSLKARFFSSPRGFNFLYDYITENKVPVFKCKTSDNKNLPESYYQSLLQLYGGENSPLARQELFGEFVNLTSGQVYYAFKRAEHSLPCPDNKALPVYIGLDFNSQNMNAVVMQYTPAGFTVIEAITLKDHLANTFSMAQELWSKYGNRAIIIPDSTANARKTSAEAGVTDIRILKNAGLRVEHTQNPRIKDRQNTVNLAFHKGRLHIDTSCTALIKELETLSQDADEGQVSHLAVAMGYVLWKLEPLQTPQPQSQNLSNPFAQRR